MNLPIGIIIELLAMHWFADFVLQTDWQAQNKSKNNKALLSHTFIYTLCWTTYIAPIAGVTDRPAILLFLPITFVAHTVQDYITSRINSRLWQAKEVHYFFVSIGFDQFLHYIQLIFTFYYLTK